MKILVLNAGSSTIKFEVVETDAERIRAGADRRILRGKLDGLGGEGRITVEAEDGARTRSPARSADHREALDAILSAAGGDGALAGVEAVGHRVVHGGERFRSAARIDEEVVGEIRACSDLAPLHNPANLRGIEAARARFGDGVPQVAVFDTAFHSTMPESSRVYGLPRALAERLKIRRYGFHGTSHRYVAGEYARLLGLPREKVDVVSLHLGNGCSACAIRGGESFDTSMGFTPLEGLLMGTRCGDLDPSILEYLARREGMGIAEIDAMLNRESGLLGLSGVSGDMRELLRAEKEGADGRAGLAIDVFCHRARKYVGAYFAALGGADGVVFTAGIGENSPEVRARICAGLERLGLRLDPARNEAATDGAAGEISAPGSALRAFVIPTREELMIARDTFGVVSGAGEAKEARR